MKKGIGYFRVLLYTLVAALTLSVVLILPSCGVIKSSYSKVYYDIFDTVITVDAFANSQEEFNDVSELIYNELYKYHRIFDIYNEYDNVVNIYNLNKSAFLKPVKVSDDLIEFLNFCIEMHKTTKGRVNICLGSVLSIWHDYRELNNNTIPSMDELQKAKEHTNINNLIIDEKNGTVFYNDSKLSLDVGAIAKGYAVQKVVDLLKEQGYNNILINAGGNVAAVGDKIGTPFNVGVNNPSTTDDLPIKVYKLKNQTLATSGGYVRFYTVGKTHYNHVINPDTLMPADNYVSVSVLYKDSAIADTISTALYTMSIKDGKKLVKKFDGMRVLWLNADYTFEEVG